MTFTTLWETPQHKVKNTHHTKILNLDDGARVTAIPPVSLSVTAYAAHELPTATLCTLHHTDCKLARLALVCNMIQISSLTYVLHIVHTLKAK